jgi:hypothetical protein
MPVFRTAERSQAFQTNSFRLRRTAIARQMRTAPFFVDAGASVANTATSNISWPTRHQAGDIGIMVIEASGDDSTVTPSGWAHLTGSPVVDVADSTGSKLMVLWRRATNDIQPSVTVPDPGDHHVARIFVFRGVRQDVAPGRAYATDTKPVASTSITWPAITTLAPNSLVLCIASRPNDAFETSFFSAFTNANLSATAEAGEAGTTTGNGGGFVLNYGTRAAMGNIGTSTGTTTISLTNAVMTLALEPSLVLPA